MSGKAWLLFTASSLLWGLPYLLIRVAVLELQPPVVVFVRVSLGALTLLPVAIAAGALRGLAAHWRSMLAVALLEVVAPFLLIAFGEQHISSSLAGLLIAAMPLFIAIMAPRFDPTERVSGVRLLGLGIGLLGVVVLLGLDAGGDRLGLLGGGLVLLAAVSYAAASLVIKRSAVEGVPPLATALASLGLAAIILAPLALPQLPAQLPSPAVQLSLAGLVLLCTTLGFLSYFSLIAEAGAARAALITYVNPAVAVVLGALILGEPITAATLAGFVLILVGCWLSSGSRLPPLRVIARTPAAGSSDRPARRPAEGPSPAGRR